MALRPASLSLALLLITACASSTRAPDVPAARGTGTSTATAGAENDAKVTIEGRLSKREIGGVIRRHLNRFIECYDLMVAKGHQREGVVRIRLIIAPSGRVEEATIAQTTLHLPRTESCMTDVMRSLEFPAPVGGGAVIVSYPFYFRPR